MKILFICTHNRCRSILSEAIANHLSSGQIIAYSAGSSPAGEVHPLTIKYLAARGIATEGLSSQSWDDFEQMNPDLVITVCDNAANESCPIWFGNTLKVHWGLPDPSKLQGTDAEIEAAFYAVMDTISDRMRALLALDLGQGASMQLREKLKQLTLEV